MIIHVLAPSQPDPSLPEPRAKSDGSLYVFTTVMCKVRPGDKCHVNFPDHSDPDSYDDHCHFHAQDARIDRVNDEHSVDLLLLTGPKAGEISKNVHPRHLILYGSYVQEA